MSYVQFPVPLSVVPATPDSVAPMLEVVGPDVFGIVLGNIKHRTRFEHDNLEAFLRKYLGSRSAGRSRTYDANLVYFRRSDNLKETHLRSFTPALSR
jgi:hypothetical protein